MPFERARSSVCCTNQEGQLVPPIAILSSMDQEIRQVEDLIEHATSHHLNGQRFVTGKLADHEVVAAISGYGKAGAAATTATGFDAKAVIFGGVAGGIRPDVQIGDVVVADRLIQHDFDASPIFDPYVIPSLGIAEIPADPYLSDLLAQAAEEYVRTEARTDAETADPGLLSAADMKVHRGLVASGDRFISSRAEADSLRSRITDVLAVEMEGAAVAQVCAERRIPFAVLRSISDRSDHDAEVDFIAFVSSVAAPLTAGVVKRWL